MLSSSLTKTPVPFFALAGVLAFVQPASGQGPAFPAAEKTSYEWNDRGWWRIAQQPEEPRPSAAANAAQPGSQAQPSQDQAANERDEKWASQLKVITSQLDAAKKRSEELVEEQRTWEANLKKLLEEGLSEPRPYSFLLLDKASDEAASDLQNADALQDAVAAAKEAVTQAKAEQEERERLLRKAKDDLEQNGGATAEPALADDVAEAQHALDLASLTLELRRLELANLQREQEVQELRLAYAKRKVDLYARDTIFTQSILDEVLAELDAREKVLSDREKEIDDTKFLNEQWYQARERLDDARVSQDESKLAVLEAEVQAKNYARLAAQLEGRLISEQQERLKRLKEAWVRRHDLATSAVAASDTTHWITDTKAALDLLRTDAANVDTAIDKIRKQLATVERKLEAADESDAALRYWLTRSSKSLEQQRKMLEDVLAQIEPARRVFEKLLEELTSGDVSVAVGRWVSEAWQNIEHIWDYELAAVDDRPITVGKIVQGLFLLFMGLYASRLISRLLGRRLLTRMGVNASAAAALQSVAFYVLVLLFALFALKMAEVPLTAFTVLGGAVALGVGFGSQNIVNNFISGLILLAERPVKVGDLIQLGELYGNVEHIGARSTRVRTGENLDIIVPNSTFLETNVVNWTLSDNNMRTFVKFGVMYGSPLGKVTHLALKAAANHDRVFDRPEPFLIFTDFGDNALEFELHFWVAVRTLMERRKIESDIRFNIDHLFREAGIVIAYPQTDVHLSNTEALLVKMLPPSGGEAA